MPTLSLLRRRGRRPSLSALFARLIQHRALLRSRARLARLDNHMLADIGVTRAEALCEAERKDWDAPDFWRR